jgi:hypothetical protein
LLQALDEIAVKEEIVTIQIVFSSHDFPQRSEFDPTGDHPSGEISRL